jgi:hypothetical protein
VQDRDGPYDQWGDSGKKYHYTSGDERGREAAKEKARRQGRAARAGGIRDEAASAARRVSRSWYC